ncbi:ferredoxin [Nocardia wallacei]|uniref:ferredoxin n=1 Tax=Nocardia wallacei TaxID=480035 RepID=UPI0024552E50|nr:ferredoxin [Nocardia wallacei]
MKEQPMEIRVDRQRCIGAGMCVLTASAVFDQDDDGLVVLLDAAPERRADVREAAQMCPSGAITVD